MTDLAPGTRMAEWLEQAWLDRYLARQLKPEERDWFEAYMLDKGELLEQVETDTQLHGAFAAGSSRGVETPQISGSLPESKQMEPDSNIAPPSRSVAAPHRHTRASEIHAVRGPNRTGWMRPIAAAAAVFLALGLGWFGRARLEEHTPASVDTSPTRIIFDASRSIFSGSRLENEDSGSEWLLVDVGVPIGAQDVALLLGTEPARRLQITPDGFVNFLVRRTVASHGRTAKVSYVLHGKKEEMNLDLSRALAGSAP